MSRPNQAELYQAFDAERAEKARRDTRITTIMASILFPLFGVLDLFVYPGQVRELYLIRGGVLVVSAVVFALTYTRPAEKHSRRLGMIEFFTGTLSIVLMVHITEGYLSPYYAGINLVLIVFLAILPLDPVRTGVVCVVTYAAYIIPIAVVGNITNPAVFLNNNFFFISTIVLVVLSSHFATRLRFREFAARHDLARANEELKTLDKLKSEFFANVSHEVRTPLTSILAPLQAFYSGDLGPLNDEQEQIIGQMYRNSLKLLDMINQMLDFSRLEAGKVQLRLSWFNLNDFVTDTVSLFEEVTQRKGVELRTETPDEVPDAFLDSDKLERILTNLLRNAIKFTDEGSITVRTGVTNENEGKMLFLEVEDTGIGIPKHHLPYIMERFRQVDSSSTRRYEGTGLGLTIAKESVDLMKGRVHVTSTKGVGSTFRVELPANLEELAPDAFRERRRRERRKSKQPPPQRDRRQKARRAEDFVRVAAEQLALMEKEIIASAEREQQPRAEGVPTEDRILLVEDNFDLRSYVRRMLSGMGHAVATAVDGLDGWQQVQAAQPDVIVSDLMMPNMDGYELLKLVKTTESTRHIPVILITAKHELESRIEGLDLGADDYLPKPINIRELDARVRNLRNMKRFQQAVAREQELKKRMEDLIMSFSQSLELRHPDTAGHSRDVLALGLMLAAELGLGHDQRLRDALLLHDIGKLGVPDHVLLKEAPLDDEEWELMKKHAEWGARLLENFETYRDIADIVLCHQERYDGRGYPKGLSGKKIPLESRIIGVADAYHAMTSDRPYRKALTPAHAAREILENRGAQFDPELANAFVRGLLRQQIITEDDLAGFDLPGRPAVVT
jgi:putative nucleotidyltransferase with HDIG domain